MQTPNLALKALAVLLTYPTAEVLAALPEIRVALASEARLPRRARPALATLCEALGRADPLDAQERYVELFDRGRATSLHLFEHVHGDSRDRGQAMVDLHAMYAEAGLDLAGHELPDYLPALLEFLSLQPFAVAEAVLGDSAHILRKVGEALAGHDSAYAAVFGALLAMIGEKPLAAQPKRVEEPPLDLDWVEEPVVFGPAGAPGGCAAAAPGGCVAAAPKESVIPFMPRPGHADQGVPR